RRILDEALVNVVDGACTADLEVVVGIERPDVGHVGNTQGVLGGGRLGRREQMGKGDSRCGEAKFPRPTSQESTNSGKPLRGHYNTPLLLAIAPIVGSALTEKLARHPAPIHQPKGGRTLSERRGWPALAIGQAGCAEHLQRDVETDGCELPRGVKSR